MLSISNFSYFIGDRVLFDDAQLHIKNRDKIGLVGLNGTGKTTLLKIMHNEITPDQGSVSKRNDCTVGYLNQDLLSVQSDESILSVAMEAFKDAVEYERQIETILKKLETDYDETLINKLTTLQEKYESLDGYALQSKAESILEGVGFKTTDLHRPLTEFSGGWRMRVMLARLLLEKPALLMLDEPTNHLDLPSIQWVENYLKTYEGAVIVVSHDKYFLDNTVNKIIEVNNFKLNTFSGNYSFYLQEKTLRDDIQKSAYLNQQQKIKQTEQFITRFRSKATKARQVQSRVKSLERMAKVEDVKSTDTTVHFNFKFNIQSGRHVKRLENIQKSYGTHEVLSPSTVGIERGDKIALIGANGIGKSTLLRIIENEEAFDGTVQTGHNVISSFYAQHQIEALNVENEILDELKLAGTDKTEQELRMVLGCFLFSGDDVFKKIKVLSGGEKSRVALAKVLISEANFLLLDEPTNHLDIVSVNILIQALQQYRGTFVLVSHDRYFISEVANKIWYIDQKEIKAYPGSYAEYKAWQEKRSQIHEKQIATPSDKQKPKQKHKSKSAKANPIKTDLKKKLEQLESDIVAMEAKKIELEDKLSDPDIYTDIDKLSSINKKYEVLKDTLEKKNESWSELAEQIDDE